MEGPVAAPPAPDDRTGGTAPSTSPPRKLKRSTRIALIVLLILALIAGGAFATSYFLNARNYVSTDNALVDGDKIKIQAPASGVLIDWSATLGAVLHRDQVVGRIRMQNGFTQPLMSVRAPADGTVAEDDTLMGTYVNSGTQLAIAYDMAKIYVTANVDETDVKAVRVGQIVDMYVDAFPNTRFVGRVAEIKRGASSQFSLFPQNNSQGSFQKVIQYIPVKIGIENRQDRDLAPGMNVTVYIHKH